MRVPTHTFVQLTATCFLAPRRCGQPLMENPSMTWPELQVELDKVPVFTIVNAGQEPCGLPVPRFFIDPSDAEAALAADLRAARGMRGADAVLAAGLLSGVRVQPVGLGSAYNLVQQGKALFVPEASGLSAAKGMEGGEQIGDGLPLVGCYQMRMPRKDGGPVTPLFMGLAEAQTARARAAEAMAMPVDELPLVIVTLEKMSGLMMDGQLRDPRAMAIVPTRRAVDYCNRAREAAAAAAAASPDAAKREQLRRIMLREADGEGSGSDLFPSS